MKKHFPGLKMKRFPGRIYSLDFEKHILSAEKKLMDYGFVKEEINFVMRYKPSFILFDHDKSFKEGFNAMLRVFVDRRGYDP